MLQSSLASIEKRTGLTVGQLIAAARDRGFDDPRTSTDAIAAWLFDDYDLRRRDAIAIIRALRAEEIRRAS